MSDPAKELWQLAPTLSELRKLPKDQKDRLFLAKLARMSRHNASALNKHNLMLPGDPHGLAHGFADAEKHSVKEHLLGAPWTRLVNEGYLVDLNGQGFHKVSVEGHEFLAQEDTPTPAAAPVVSTVSSTQPPSAFISYSWDGPEHQKWVNGLATRLQGKSGVGIVFDQWDLQPGEDKQHFMEQAGAAQDFVIIICTENYATRANNREGGVGYETMVITGEMAEDMLSKTFIPVLRQGTFKTSLPIYIKSKLGVDLRGEPYSEAEYERLIRVLHGEPLKGPPIGKKPDFSKRRHKPKAKAASTLIDAVVTSTKTAGPTSAPPRPSAVVHARYDKPGVAEAWKSAIIRHWDDIDGDKNYSFESLDNDNQIVNEIFGCKDDIIETFINFQRKLYKDGYKRMNFRPGIDSDFAGLN